MRRKFKNIGNAYQFHMGNLCNFLSRTLNIKDAYLRLQCVCLRECIKEMSKPTMNFEYFNALFTMVKNTWAKKIKTSIWNHHCGIKAAYTNQIQTNNCTRYSFIYVGINFSLAN